MKTINITKTGFNNRQRKVLSIVAILMDKDGNALDAINPGEGNHRTALDWAEWRANTICKDYKEACKMVIYCGDDEIATIEFAEIQEEENNMRNEQITMLKRELQAYCDNASKGGVNRRRNMLLLRWDIRRLERANKINIEMHTITAHFEDKQGNTNTVTTSINGTPDEISSYYINKWFNFPDYEDRNGQDVYTDHYYRGVAIDFLN